MGRRGLPFIDVTAATAGWSVGMLVCSISFYVFCCEYIPRNRMDKELGLISGGGEWIFDRKAVAHL